MLLPIMLAKSIGVAGLNATISPGALQPWIDEIEQRVAEEGKFSKSAVAYIPFSPPPSTLGLQVSEMQGVGVS